MKAKSFTSLLFLFAVFAMPAFSRSICGTEQIIKNRRGLLGSNKLAESITSDVCDADAFYDSVYTRTTEHFQIFYTLSGPHKTTTNFVDSVAYYIEQARKFHTENMDMLPPLGTSETYHYQKPVKQGLYPVEILDISLIRDTYLLMRSVCNKCYGVTIPDEDGKSSLVIENDFKGTPNFEASKGTFTQNGQSCTYSIATEELRNDAHNYSYATQWGKGIKVTAVHELYHAVQLRYLSKKSWDTFWFEASAAGMEEIVAPEIDDYFNYLKNMSVSVGIPLDKMAKSYGAGIFLIYLHNFVDPKADKYIWENFSKNPDLLFQDQFKAFVEKKNLSADSLFQDFSTRTSFAGSRSVFLDSSQLICKDEANWPNFQHIQSKTNDQNVSIKPAVNNLAYKFYSNGSPELKDYQGKVSAVLYQGNKATIHNPENSKDVETLYAQATASSNVDSIVWVFSNFSSQEYFPAERDSSTLRAYPTPWRQGNLCFSPLPRDKDYIEIRNRRGNLISREKYENTILCLEEARVKELMAPGLYHFRAGNRGKAKDFMVIY